jgi:hypothetical protein
VVIFERKIVTAELVERRTKAGRQEAGQLDWRVANGAFDIDVKNTVYPYGWGCVWIGHGELPFIDLVGEGSLRGKLKTVTCHI